MIKYVLALLAAATPASAACAPRDFDGNAYTVCRFDPASARVELFNLNRAGEPFGSFSALEAELVTEGKSLAFAMNAGMYDDALRPVGLYVEAGAQAKALNRRKGPGNFHLKPNGVFYVKDGRAAVAETEAFTRSGVRPDFASQSGPMLVVNGRIHPAFSPTGTSLKRRNGAGVARDGAVVFAISEDAVRFHDFARLFRDAENCPDALFFDGTVSSLYAPELGRNDRAWPLGPIVGVVK